MSDKEKFYNTLQDVAKNYGSKTKEPFVAESGFVAGALWYKHFGTSVESETKGLDNLPDVERKFYVKGNQHNPAKVIHTLEALGGKNVSRHRGGGKGCIYYIDSKGEIDFESEETFRGMCLMSSLIEIPT